MTASAELVERAEPAAPSPWWATAAIGLLLARWLVPTESAADGETAKLVFLWFALAAAWFAVAARRGRAITLDRVDVAVAALSGSFVLSGLLTLTQPANWRTAVNMTAEWAGTGIALLILRQMIAATDGLRATRAIACLLVGLAGYGLYQHFVWYPSIAATYAEFETLADQRDAGTLDASGRQRLSELIADLGPEAASRDARGRAALRQRVAFSTEPIGFFGLANSYATGMLVGVVLLAAFTLDAGGRDRIVLASLLAAVFVTFLLTKSRTAVVGGVAAAAIFAWRMQSRSQTGTRWLLPAVGGIAAIGGIAFLVAILGGLDAAVVTEAPKSLRYRLEYWTATGDLLAERPVLGSGLGQFRSHYLTHKLDAASEEVSDPHNWLLEAWAAGGLLGGIAAVVFVVFALLLAACATGTDEPMTDDKAVPALLTAGLLAVLCGGSVVAVSAVVVLACLGALVPVRLTDRRWRAALLAAAVGIAVHLLGAGGWNFPAIHQLWFVCLLLPLDRQNGWTASPRLVAVGSVVCVSSCVATFFAVERPVAARKTSLIIAQFEASTNPLSAKRFATNAAAADTLSPQPYALLAALPGQSLGDRVAALREAIARYPRQAYLHDRLAVRLAEAGEIDSAERASKRAVVLYPSSPKLHASRALLPIDDGLRRDAATRALELDATLAAAGHEDKRLPKELRREMQDMIGAER